MASIVSCSGSPYQCIPIDVLLLLSSPTCVKGITVAPLFQPDSIGGSEPDPGCSVTTISLYQNHLSKMCESDFNLGQAHKHLQIQYNSFTKYAFNQK